MIKILVVDDEEVYRSTLLDLLTLEGYGVEVAASAEAAMDMAARFAPDLLIADRMLGGSASGFSVARDLRRRDPTIAIIVMSGYVPTGNEEKLEELRSVSFLAKPFEFEQLLAMIRASVRTRSGR